MKVRVDMDEGWHWWFITSKSQEELLTAMGHDEEMKHVLRRAATLEIPQDLYDEAQAAWATHRAVQDKLEQLYRVQEGIEPWQSPPVPEHVLLVQPKPRDAIIEELTCTQPSQTTS